MKNTFGSSLGKALGTKPPEMNGFDTRRARQLTHYCIVRRDLPLGVIGAQLVHAAGESSPGDLDEGTFAVCLAAKNEEHILELERRLKEAGINHTAVREPDAPWDGALMALGVAPLEDRTVLRPITGNLPLLR